MNFKIKNKKLISPEKSKINLLIFWDVVDWFMQTKEIFPWNVKVGDVILVCALTTPPENSAISLALP